jgi:TPR repeat protein
MQRYLSATRRQLILGLLLGTCISAAVGVAAIKYSNYRHENTVPGKAAAELAAEKSPSDALPLAAVNPVAANSAPADIFGSSQNKAVAKVRASAIPAAETGGHSGPYAAEATSANPLARASLQPSFGANTSRQKSPMTPEQLWASVQAGNTKSAVTLAELYIKGEGVPQNCNQARVLLLVASEKRNAGAIKRLQELDKTDCPAN